MVVVDYVADVQQRYHYHRYSSYLLDRIDYVDHTRNHSYHNHTHGLQGSSYHTHACDYHYHNHSDHHAWDSQNNHHTGMIIWLRVPGALSVHIPYMTSLSVEMFTPFLGAWFWPISIHSGKHSNGKSTFPRQASHLHMVDYPVNELFTRGYQPLSVDY